MSLASFNKRSRPELFRTLTSNNFDLIVIGGGICGASIFRDAVLRGMNVALLEARDFASGTSSRSSKLIHGGLRYLKNFNFRLAWESCHERNLHLRLNKRLVRPLPFLIPLYRDRGDSRLLVRIGMWFYELSAGFRNHPFHRFLNRDQTLRLAPGLPRAGLTGGCLYYDATVDDCRWTLEIIKDGVRHGGLAVNYAPVCGFLRRNDSAKLSGVRFRDALGTGEYSTRGRCVVNATGVFGDQVRRLDRPDAPRLLRLSKGTHLVFADADVPVNVTVAFASPLDGRLMFLIKREGCFLYGTSDDWETASPDAPVPGRSDVGYLLQSLARFMPQARLGRDQVKFVYSGFRALVSPGNTDADVNPSAVTREDFIEIAPSGLISVMGGKLTTARVMAQRVLSRVSRALGRGHKGSRCQTKVRPVGGSHAAVAEGLASWVKRFPRCAAAFQTLFDRYGLDAQEICADVARSATSGRGDGCPAADDLLRAEVRYVCQNEMVCTVEDIIERRTGSLHWSPETRLERLRFGRKVIQKELGLDDEEFAEQYESYRRHLKRFHSLPPENER